MSTRLVIGVVLLCVTPAVCRAQRPQAALTPADITVGDVFHAAIRVETPGTTTVIVPESLTLGPDLELAGLREIRIDTAAGVPRTTVIYPLTAWRPGTYALEDLILRLVSDDGERVVTVQLPEFVVRSVLPADTAGIEPQAAKDVLGANRLWWPIVLGIVLVALLGAVLYAWWRRRTPRAAPLIEVPAIAPRDAALARIEQLRRSGLLERGELKPFYEGLTETLRRYAATVDPSWSQDLTTRELSARMRAAGLPEALALTRILGTADLVKFARATIAAAHGRADLEAARTWIERVPPPPVPVEASDERRVA